MGFWSDTWAKYWSGAGATPNATIENPDSVGPTYNPGDPNGVEILDDDVAPQNRMAAIVPSPWDGWPANWSSPQWSQLGPKFDNLVDTAWAALDLNSSVLSAMPVYRVRSGQVLPATTWMGNPDPDIYSGWPEFAKQLFWDFQMGEAFILRMASAADGWPYSFRVVPPWLINVEMDAGRRVYSIGKLDVTDDILHIRYKSTSDGARGSGPLESAGARLVAAAMLAKYASDIAAGNGIPKYVLETDLELDQGQVDELREQWWQSRMADMEKGMAWKPAMLSHGLKANTLQLDPQKMALLDLAQYTESRISNLLGVPAFLLGLATGDPMTYSNASTLFDFHDRRYLKTAAVHVMTALSNWALPRGQAVELNRDEYARPPLKERVEAYEKLLTMGVLSKEEIRVMERFVDAGAGPTAEESDEDLVAAEALTGGGRS
jgi:HK97 family phage portal protein